MKGQAGMLLSQAAARAAMDESGLPGVSPATAKWFKGSVKRLVEFLGGDSPAAAVRPVDIREWQWAEVEKGVAGVTVNSYLRGVKTVYARLVKQGELESNPAAGVKFLSELPPRPKAISEADYLAMREAADCARDRAIVDVLWASGCRLGGLLAMRVDALEQWEGPDGSHRFALLVVEKGQKGRWVYIGRDRLQGEGLWAYLEERPAAESSRLFLTTVRPWSPLSGPAAQHVLMKLKRAAGIPKERPANAHSFRHAFAMRMLDEGLDLPAVSAMLGHHSPEFTGAVYVVRSERQLRQKYFG